MTPLTFGSADAAGLRPGTRGDEQEGVAPLLPLLPLLALGSREMTTTIHRTMTVAGDCGVREEAGRDCSG